ncbi:MAG TPA: phosphatase PAP2 family protein [Candidatus Limnocylindrales bacterium]|nr:phosphatase PAP2 family protein [Candidatus Limnocylindrales bacterium]
MSSATSISRPLRAALIALACLLAWDASGADLALARWFGTPWGFPLRGQWFLVDVMHQGARLASWVFVGFLLIGIRWPLGVLRRLGTAARVQLALTGLASVIVVSLLKQASHTSCPWDLRAFGGVASYVSHWDWGVPDGGPGGYFPAGHASSAFAGLGGYFVFRRASARVARVWLVVVLLLGLALGIAQQIRGAHYMSHTLWTAWLCWMVALIIDRVAAGRSRPCEVLTLPFSH